ncbi:peptidylprolyl isomerase [Luedemannella flava]|uniref:Peptidylprolyl isomerase n=1 Tax=Luedemannella flava TaxID=349316 RepID=A0ABP4YIA6_9ACTN
MASSRDRQRKLARARIERRLVNRAKKIRRKRQVQAGIGAVVALLVVALGTVWLAGGFDKKPDTPPNVVAGDCAWTLRTPDEATGIRDTGNPPITPAAKAGTRTMTIATNVGQIDASLDLDAAPCTAESFAYLAGKNFFDNTTCHRLSTNDFVLHCGDPVGKGTGGPSYTFIDENLPAASAASPSASPAATNHYPAGTIAMANPGANGSQFLIFYKDGSALPPNYSIAGKVTKGLDVVEKVAKDGALDGEGKATSDGAPKTNVTITKLTVGDAPVASPSATPQSSATTTASAQ